MMIFVRNSLAVVRRYCASTSKFVDKFMHNDANSFGLSAKALTTECGSHTTCVLKYNYQKLRFSPYSIRFFSVSQLKRNISQNSLKLKRGPIIGKRPMRKKQAQISSTEDNVLVMSAFSTAEEYNLEDLKRKMESDGVYLPGDLPDDADDALYVKAKYEIDGESREMFFFRQGCVVFWNMPENEMNDVILSLRNFSEGVYPESLIYGEEEQMDYIYTQNASKLRGGVICVQRDNSDLDAMVLHKYAFSNALCTAVKLGIWEASLDEFVESIEPILEDLKYGTKLRMSKHEVLRKTGELYTLRHLINLSSDLLEPPDFYWDRDDLEDLYMKSLAYLNIPKRTRVINEKLSHCCDLTDLLTTHLNNNHHVRLEWMIIVLIAIEVVFEVAHLITQVMEKDKYNEGDIAVTEETGS